MFQRKIARFSAKQNRYSFALLWRSSLLLIFLSTSLTACSVFSESCSGSNVTCGSATPTPNAPVLVATANAITQSTPLLSDPLSQPDDNLWDTNADCFFQNGAYVATYNGQDLLYSCALSKAQYSNVAIQMDVTLVSGSAAGILFRMDPTSNVAYDFEITSLGQFDFQWVGENHTTTTLIPATAKSSVHGLGQKNTLLVIASNNDFQFLVNGVVVGETHEGTLTTGSIGVSIADYGAEGKAIFSNLLVYQA